MTFYILQGTDPIFIWWALNRCLSSIMQMVLQPATGHHFFLLVLGFLPLIPGLAEVMNLFYRDARSQRDRESLEELEKL